MKRRIALLGAGTVGTGAYKLIMENGTLMAQNHGVEIEVVKILVRDLEKEIEALKALPQILNALTQDDREKTKNFDNLI